MEEELDNITNTSNTSMETREDPTENPNGTKEEVTKTPYRKKLRSSDENINLRKPDRIDTVDEKDEEKESVIILENKMDTNAKDKQTNLETMMQRVTLSSTTAEINKEEVEDEKRDDLEQLVEEIVQAME